MSGNGSSDSEFKLGILGVSVIDEFFLLRDSPKLATVKFNNGSFQTSIPNLLRVTGHLQPDNVLTIPINISETLLKKLEALFNDNRSFAVDNPKEAKNVAEIALWMDTDTYTRFTAVRKQSSRYVVFDDFCRIRVEQDCTIQGKTTKPLSCPLWMAMLSNVIREKIHDGVFEYDGPNEDGLVDLRVFFQSKDVNFTNPGLKRIAIELEINPLISLIERHEERAAKNMEIFRKYQRMTEQLCKLQDALVILSEENYSDAVKLAREMKTMDVVQAIWRVHQVTQRDMFPLLAKFVKEATDDEGKSILKGLLIYKSKSYRMVYELFKLDVFTLDEIRNWMIVRYEVMSQSSNCENIREKIQSMFQFAGMENEIGEFVPYSLSGSRLSTIRGIYQDEYGGQRKADPLFVCFAPELNGFLKHIEIHMTGSGSSKNQTVDLIKSLGIDTIKDIRDYQTEPAVKTVLMNDDVEEFKKLIESGEASIHTPVDICYATAEKESLSILRYAISCRAEKCISYLMDNFNFGFSQDMMLEFCASGMEIVKAELARCTYVDFGAALAVGLTRNAKLLDLIVKGRKPSHSILTGILHSGYLEGSMNLLQYDSNVLQSGNGYDNVDLCVLQIQHELGLKHNMPPSNVVYTGSLSFVQEEITKESDRDIIVDALGNAVVLGFDRICEYLIGLLGDAMPSVVQKVFAVGSFGHSEAIKKMLLPYMNNDTVCLRGLRWAVWTWNKDFVFSVLPLLDLSHDVLRMLFLTALNAGAHEIARHILVTYKLNLTKDIKLLFSRESLEDGIDMLLDATDPKDYASIAPLIIEHHRQVHFSPKMMKIHYGHLIDIIVKAKDYAPSCFEMAVRYRCHNIALRIVSNTRSVTELHRPAIDVLEDMIGMAWIDVANKLLDIPDCAAQIRSATPDIINSVVMSGNIPLLERIIELKGGVNKMRRVLDRAVEYVAPPRMFEHRIKPIMWTIKPECGTACLKMFKYLMNILQSSTYISLALITATRSNNMDLMIEILKYDGVNVNTCIHKDGQTPLINCITNNMIDGVKLLLEHPSIDVNFTCSESSPLLIAVYINAIEIVELLIRAPGFNPDRNQMGKCLFVAMHSKFWDIVLLLMTVDFDLLDAAYSIYYGNSTENDRDPHRTIVMKAIFAHPRFPKVIPARMPFVMDLVRSRNMALLKMIMPSLDNGIAYEVENGITLMDCFLANKQIPLDAVYDGMTKNDILVAILEGIPYADSLRHANLVFNSVSIERAIKVMEMQQALINRPTRTHIVHSVHNNISITTEQPHKWARRHPTGQSDRFTSMRSLLGHTVLDYMLQTLQPNMIPTLASMDVDWTKQNPWGFSYLETVAIYSFPCLHEFMTKCRIDKKELLNTDENGATLLMKMWSVKSTNCRFVIGNLVRQLLLAGADIYQKDNMGRTVLDYMKRPDLLAVKMDQTEFLKFVVTGGKMF